MTKKIKLSNCDEYTLVDDADYDRLNKYRWRKGGNGYVCRDVWLGRTTVLLMHRLIMDRTFGDGKIVDHINWDKLDNRRNNLRVGDKSLNALNAKMRSDNKSGVRNLSFDKSRHKWRYSFKSKGKVYTGRCDGFIEAVKVMEKRKKETKYAEILGGRSGI